MELTNRTAATAQLMMGVDQHGPNRVGLVIAKLSYRVDPSGHVELDGDDPVPVFMKDESGPLGILPREDSFPEPTWFQVMLNGIARYAAPTTRAQVRMQVGSVNRTLQVIGDRHLLSATAPPTEPTPFTAMPLTWCRAQGGSATVEIDEDSSILTMDPVNPGGRGFDPMNQAKLFAHTVDCPSGFPRHSGVRPLANIFRSPADEASSPKDPYGWSAMPLSVASQLNVVAKMANGGPADPSLALLHRAHPDWQIDPPAAGALVHLSGLGHDELTFRIPTVRIFVDYEVDDRGGVLEAAPEMLVILSEERRFYLVFRTRFRIPNNTQSACLRLRMAEGWNPRKAQSC